MFKTLKMATVSVVVATGMTLGGGAAFAADDYPSQAIQFIVPYSAGGGQDRWARVIASGGSEHLGQSINVEVRPGAGSTVGWAHLLSQPADGYTMMIGSLSPQLSVLSEELPVTHDDIAIVNIVSDFNVILMSLPGSDWADWDSMVAYAEANPGALTIGGTVAQALAVAAVFDQAGLEGNVITYPGTAAAVTDMLGGHIDMAVVTPASAIGLGDQAVSVANLGARPNSDEMNAQLGGDVPWVGDMGYDGLPQPRWIGVHPDTPVEIIDKLDEGIRAILEAPSTQSLIRALGEEVIYQDRASAQAAYDRAGDTIRTYLPLLQ
ncbi:Bug family tripartite tricarboxylate transporter substrate binding protein [Alkalilacustris brevis]|uniref:Bug family tripartite tricarboxylate transporter substrate binding protein n=1 Tax=Alkalilacustris brevis TaxID=2026338 RepID=UPI0013906830|nr:tripartite tricarboxylate transporter substrate binding protein [Alkalilacustris brevis]